MPKYIVSDSDPDPSQETIQETKPKKSQFFSKFKQDLLNALKAEVQKNQENLFDILDPFLEKFVEKIQFEFHLYLLLGGLGIVFIIILFIINLFFIVKFRNTAIVLNKSS